MTPEEEIKFVAKEMGTQTDSPVILKPNAAQHIVMINGNGNVTDEFIENGFFVDPDEEANYDQLSDDIR